MSTHWDIYCVDCDDSLGLNRSGATNHAEDTLADLLGHREALAAMAVVGDVNAVWRDTVYLDASWFALHREHALAVQSEYGYLLCDCREVYKCPTCGTWEQCRRETGHDGDCAKVRDYDPSVKP